MKALVSLLQTAVVLSVLPHGATSAPQSGTLLEPIEVASSRGWLELELSFTESLFRGPCHEIATRMYSFMGVPSSPGPTFRIRPGDHVSVTLRNTLSPDPDPGVMNRYRLPRTTNLHTHGLHVSPRQPGDEVLNTTVNGGESYRYFYRIPDNHAEGLHWYHPHKHGSGALQVGGGAVGAIIVDNEGGGLPEEIATMPRSVMVLSQWDFAEMDAIAKESGDTIWRYRSNGDCSDAERRITTNFFTVNGQYQPSVVMTVGRWHRLQVVNASLKNWINILPPVECEFQLLAKDGIYLRELPRPVVDIILPGGGRSDFAVRCLTDGVRDVVSAKPTGKGQDLMWEGLLFRLFVRDSLLPTQPELGRVIYQLPDYLEDLTQLQPDRTFTIVQNDKDLPGTYTINGVPFNPSEPIYRTQLETLEEWTLGNIDQHTFHIHVTPFQLVTGGKLVNSYLQRGDWHDTVYFPDLPQGLNHTAVIRLRPESFAGDYVMHCHILTHQDQGMMAFIRVIPALTGSD